jgi:carboxyl-terminal processing protease
MRRPGPASTTTLLALALCAMPGVAVAAESRAEVGPADLQRLTKVVRLVKHRYLHPVDDTRIAASCVDRLYSAPGLEQKRPREPVTELAQIPLFLRRVAAEAPDDVVRAHLVDECLVGLVASLDPYSSYTNAEASRELRGRGGDLGGLGLTLGIRGGAVVILHAMEGGPAASAEITPSDRLTAIDGRAVQGQRLAEVVRQLRGRPGSSVSITLERAGATRTVTLQRAIFKVQTVRARALEPGYLHVSVWEFRETTSDDIRRALAELTTGEGAVPPRTVLLDLRDNQGGLLTAAMDVASLFLREGAVIGSTDDRIPAGKKRFTATPRRSSLPSAEAARLEGVTEMLRTVPLFVLTNSFTASGAEIVAAALQGNARAALLGTPTAGIGHIQTLIPLDDVMLRLTTSTWIIPGGRPLEGQPLVPDVALLTLRGDAAPDVELAQAFEVVKQRLMPAAAPSR